MHQPNFHSLTHSLTLSLSLSVCLPACLSVCLSLSLSPCPHLCIYVAMPSLSVHPSTHVIQPAFATVLHFVLSIYPSIHPSLSLYLSIPLYTSLSLYLSIPLYLAVIQLPINSLSRSTLHPSIICLSTDPFVYLFNPNITDQGGIDTPPSPICDLVDYPATHSPWAPWTPTEAGKTDMFGNNSPQTPNLSLRSQKNNLPACPAGFRKS